MNPRLRLASDTRVHVASRDTAFVRSLEDSLRARGAQVYCWAGAGAWSVDEAVVDGGGVDVVVIETSGLGDTEWALVERVRERCPLAEIVAIVSGALVERAVQAMRDGVYAFLAYPVSDDQIAEVIAGAAARRRRAEHRLRLMTETGGAKP